MKLTQDIEHQISRVKSDSETASLRGDFRKSSQEGKYRISVTRLLTWAFPHRYDYLANAHSRSDLYGDDKWCSARA